MVGVGYWQGIWLKGEEVGMDIDIRIGDEVSGDPVDGAAVVLGDRPSDDELDNQIDRYLNLMDKDHPRERGRRRKSVAKVGGTKTASKSAAAARAKRGAEKMAGRVAQEQEKDHHFIDPKEAAKVMIALDDEDREALNQFCNQHHIPSHIAAVRVLIAAHEDVVKVAAELEEEHATVAAELDKIERDWQDVEQARETLRQANDELSRNVRLSRDVMNLMAELVNDGMTRDDVVRFAKAMKAAGVEPMEAAQFMGTVGGLIGWIKELREAEAAAKEQRAKTEDLLASNLIAAKKAQEKLKEIEAAHSQYTEAINNARFALDRLSNMAAQAGVAMDMMRVYGIERVAGVKSIVLRMVAGMLIMAATGQYGDEVVVVPGNPIYQRMMPVRLALSEIPTILAPESVYAEVKKQNMRREVMAEIQVEDEEV